MTKNYILAIFLAVFTLTLDTPISAGLLELSDEEIEQRNLKRASNVTNDYFSQNSKAVLTLIEKEFFNCSVDAFVTDEESREIFRAIAQERKSCLARSYNKNTKDLREDLEEIKTILISNEETLFGLEDEDELAFLRRYISALLHITSYFEHLKKQNIAL